jgi:hypothetical protein
VLTAQAASSANFSSRLSARFHAFSSSSVRPQAMHTPRLSLHIPTHGDGSLSFLLNRRLLFGRYKPSATLAQSNFGYSVRMAVQKSREVVFAAGELETDVPINR